MHPLRKRYIEAGYIMPLPDKLTVPQMIERGFWAAAYAAIGAPAWSRSR